MAKSRRSRGNRRADPLGSGDKPKAVKPPSDPELAALREKSILPVLRDLQSSDPKSRTQAAAAVANIIQDARCRKLLLREQVVRVLLTDTLTDASLESRAAGWEILRVLTAEEDPDFCVHLYRVDVLTAAQHAAAKIADAIAGQPTAFAKRPQAEQRFVWIIAEALAAIVAAVAEAQDDALAAIGQSFDILRLLFALLSAAADDAAPAPVVEGALSCMLTLSEDNRQFAEAVVAAAPSYKQLINLSQQQNEAAAGSFRAVLASGVLHNVFASMQWHDQSPGQDGACDAVLVPALVRALEQTPLARAETQQQGQKQQQQRGGDDEGKASPVDVLQVALEVLASIGTTLQETLEKANKADQEWNGIAEDDKKDAEDTAMDAEGDDIDDGEDKDDEEEGGDGSDDEMDQDELEADMEMVTGADDHDDEDAGLDDLPTLRELLQKAVPQLIKTCQSAAGRSAGAGGEAEAAAMVHGHALSALNNVAWTVSVIDFSERQNAPIQRAWTPAALAVWRDVVAPVLASDTSDVDLATATTSLAWALARTLRHEQGFLSGGEPKKFISLYHASRNLGSSDKGKEGAQAGEDAEDPFQGLGVKCIGVLGQLALDPAPTELNREIGVFLMTVIGGLGGGGSDDRTPAADGVEALNQVFDVYGDESRPCDEAVFWADGFLPHLEAAVPRLRQAIRPLDKRRFPELRTRAEEALLNLQRFIKYKQKHQPAAKA